MDIYQNTLKRLIEHPSLHSWPEMQDLVERAVAPRPAHWMLPVYACKALGADQKRALPVVSALACLQSSIILIDDLLDEDPRGEHLRVGPAAAANMASAFQALGLELLMEFSPGTISSAPAVYSLNRMMLETAFGQYVDTQNPSDQAAYWQLVRAKSSPFFGATLEASAWIAGATPEVARQFKDLGSLYGEMVQILDDLNDSLAIPASPDWISGRLPLPILYAQSMDYPERDRFLKLRSEVRDPDKLEQAQSILIRCGAVSYCLDQTLRRFEQASSLLDEIPLSDSKELEAMLIGLVLPVRNLLDTFKPDRNGQ